MIEGKTLVCIWEDQKGSVSTDFAFDGMNLLTAMKVNFMLDRLKLLLQDRLTGGAAMDESFIPGVPDGG